MLQKWIQKAAGTQIHSRTVHFAAVVDVFLNCGWNQLKQQRTLHFSVNREEANCVLQKPKSFSVSNLGRGILFHSLFSVICLQHK